MGAVAIGGLGWHMTLPGDRVQRNLEYPMTPKPNPLRPKSYRKTEAMARGMRHPPQIQVLRTVDPHGPQLNEAVVVVTPGISIVLVSGCGWPVRFFVGDQAVHDSFNLSYLGEILSITERTVTIVGHQGKPTRLSLSKFYNKNCNYNAARIAADNRNVGQCI